MTRPTHERLHPLLREQWRLARMSRLRWMLKGSRGGPFLLLGDNRPPAQDSAAHLHVHRKAGTDRCAETPTWCSDRTGGHVRGDLKGLPRSS